MKFSVFFHYEVDSDDKKMERFSVLILSSFTSQMTHSQFRSKTYEDNQLGTLLDQISPENFCLREFEIKYS